MFSSNNFKKQNCDKPGAFLEGTPAAGMYPKMFPAPFVLC